MNSLGRSLVLFGTLTILVSGCGNLATGRQPAPDGRIQVAATTGMIGDIVQNVGGNMVHTQVMMGPGVDPHLYKASEKDIRLLNNAEIIFYNGLHLEGKISDLLEKLASKKPVYEVSETINRKLLLKPADGGKNYDPHIWFDVSLWMKATEVVRDRLIEFAPEHKEQFTDNAEAYLRQLKELHFYAREKIAEIPERQRALVTAHDAFGYFGKAYDIEVRGIQGLSTESEASVQDINHLVAFLKRQGVKAVFVESTISRKNIEALIEGANAAGHPVKIGGELFSDAMGAEGTEGGTYIGMVRHNVDAISRGLK